MTSKFHINKHGVPAPCKATKGKCPLGGEELHFRTFDEAQAHADKIGENSFGLLPTRQKKEYKVAEDENDKKYIDDRLSRLRYEDKQKQKNTNGRFSNYMSRCRSSEWMPDYKPSNIKSTHFINDRSRKAKTLSRQFDEGNLVGYYKVNHVVKEVKGKKMYDNQVVEIRDNGRIAVYDYNNGQKITTFMAHEERLEVMMLQAGQIPDKDFLKKAKENFLKESTFRKNMNLRRNKNGRFGWLIV